MGQATGRLDSGRGLRLSPASPAILLGHGEPTGSRGRVGGRQEGRHVWDLLTFDHQRVVVVNFQAEKPGGARPPEGQASFLWVVKGLQGGGGRAQPRRQTGRHEGRPWGVRANPPAGA